MSQAPLLPSLASELARLNSTEYASCAVVCDCTREDMPIIFTTDGFIRWTGYPREEIIGRNCRFLQCEETDPEAVGKIARAIHAARPLEIDLINRAKDGTLLMNRLKLQPYLDGEGRLHRYFGYQEFTRLEDTATAP